MLYRTNEESGLTGAMILELCQSHELVRWAIEEGCELLLPRLRMETGDGIPGPKAEKRCEWVAECWWRSAEKGTLDYFVKLDLLTKSILEFRELPGDIPVSGMEISDGEIAYLSQAAALAAAGSESEELADALDRKWQSLVPDSLREYALQKKEEQTFASYVLPVEALTCWNWESLRDMLLKRENTTVERIRDYIEYKQSGSNKLYIPPEQRADAKARGMKFWRDDDDL